MGFNSGFKGLSKDVRNLNNTGRINLQMSLSNQEDDVGNLPAVKADFLLPQCQLLYFSSVSLLPLQSTSLITMQISLPADHLLHSK